MYPAGCETGGPFSLQLFCHHSEGELVYGLSALSSVFPSRCARVWRCNSMSLVHFSSRCVGHSWRHACLWSGESRKPLGTEGLDCLHRTSVGRRSWLARRVTCGYCVRHYFKMENTQLQKPDLALHTELAILCWCFSKICKLSKKCFYELPSLKMCGHRFFHFLRAAEAYRETSQWCPSLLPTLCHQEGT